MARKQKSEKELVVSSGAAAAAASRHKTATTRTKHSLTQAETPSTPIVELSTAQPAPPAAAQCEPTYDDISQQAYLYWEARGYQGGSPEEDWLRAEQELRARVSTLTA